METDFFQSCGHCWVFQIFWQIAFSILTASSFMLWNSWAGIPSPSLVLFLRPTWLHIPGCLALGEWSHLCDYLGHEDLFCIVPLCTVVTSFYYLLLLLGPYHFCPLLALLCMKCSLGISNFLEEISSLSHSFLFLHFFALILFNSIIVPKTGNKSNFIYKKYMITPLWMYTYYKKKSLKPFLKICPLPLICKL